VKAQRIPIEETPAHIDAGITISDITRFTEISDRDYRSIHLPCLPFKEVESEPAAHGEVAEAALTGLYVCA
jgi:hypothetical protein